MVFIPVSIFLSKFKYDAIKIRKKIYFLLTLTIIIFISRNLIRIDKEIENYGYNPTKNAFFYLNKDGFIINDNVEKIYNNWKIKNKSFLIIKR